MSYTSVIMNGLLVALGIVLLYLLFLALRNPILAKLGVRNIGRRPAQSVLIVVGLTLSTIIVVSALALGDTLSYSVQRQAVSAYGEIDEILAPPLISLFVTLGADLQATDGQETSQSQEQLNQLLEGGLTSVLTVLEGGLPGISEERYLQLQTEAQTEPLIDAVAASIVFPTILRDVTTGQGEPLGFIFAVDPDYDQTFGLTTLEGEGVEMEALEPGVGNIFLQATNLFGVVEGLAQNLGLENFQISDVAIATAAVGAALTAAGSDTGVDLADIDLPLETLQKLGIDTKILEDAGLESLSLDALGLDQAQLESFGVTTTTLRLNEVGQAVGIDTQALSGLTTDLLGALNLNTLGQELDRVLAQVGLQLRQGDVYLNRLGAERLNARVGDVLEIFIGPIPLPFRVKAIVDQAGPMGAIAPVVMMRLDEAQQLLFMTGKVNAILVSNQGDALDGLAYTTEVSNRLRALAMEPGALDETVALLRQPEVMAVIQREAPTAAGEMRSSVEGPPAFIADFITGLVGADTTADFLDGLPAALSEPEISDGLRDILANSFVRQQILEMTLPGEAKTQLTRVFGELNEFDVVDALNKATVVTAAGIGGSIFSTVFSLFGFFSILAGVLLVFLIFVMLAAERRSEMGMARAIGVQRRQLVQMFVTEGMVYDLLSAAVGVGLGLAVSYAMIGFIGSLFNDVTGQLAGQSAIFRFQFRAAPASMVIAYCMGVLFTFLIVTVASWRISRLNIVSAIRDLPEPPGASRTSWIGRAWRLLVGPLLMAGGGWLLWQYGDLGLSLLQAGVGLISVGVSFFLGWVLERLQVRPGRVQRTIYTLIGAALLAIWTLPWATWLDSASSGIQTGGPLFLLSFILTGPMLILGSILVIMFNADAWTWGISHLLGGIGALAPVLKMAVAYPLSARFRTGMVMLMFAIVVSTVVIMTVVIQATQTLITPDDQRTAGFEIEVAPSLLSFFQPIADLEGAMAGLPDFPLDQIEAVGAVSSQSGRATQQGGSEPERYVQLEGVNPGYWQQAAKVYTIQSRAPGYDSDAAVWEAMGARQDVAIATAGFVAGETDGFGLMAEGDGPQTEMHQERMERFRPLQLAGVDATNPVLPEIWLTLRGASEEIGVTESVQVIAVLAQNSTLAGEGLHVNLDVLSRLNGAPVSPEKFYVKVVPTADAHAVAASIERAFLGSALNATLLAESFAQGQAVTRGILQLFQGFMALGLLVGVAALGVISTRMVVERRQEIGMLRAIGFQARMVSASLLIESSFIALTGLAIGCAAGVVVGQAMVAQFLDALADGQQFAIPWGQIGLIVLLAYGAALLTTILPAYQAARTYPAEALRYE